MIRRRMFSGKTKSLEYTLSSDGTYYLCTGIGDFVNANEITILNEYKGLPVKRVGNNAFENNTNLTSLILQPGIERVGDWVFHGCSNLTNFVMPDTVTYLGNYTFKGCKLPNLNFLPANYTRTGNYTFEGNNFNSPLIIPSFLTYIDWCSFRFIGVTEVIFTSKPTNLSALAFNGNKNVVSVKVPWAEGEVANLEASFANSPNVVFTYNYFYQGE